MFLSVNFHYAKSKKIAFCVMNGIILIGEEK